MKARNTAAMDEANVEKKTSVLWEYTRSILVALALALTIRTFVVQPFEIPSGSMEETLLIGDRILVNKFIYGTKLPFSGARILKVRDPARGDVIVFEFPADRSKDFIKRIVGLPGDQIEIIDKKVHVNGKLDDNPHAVHKTGDIISGAQSSRDNMGMIKVPADTYFVMGDNRDSSYDSRFWGYVGREGIKGAAFLKYWSWSSDKWRVRWERIGRPVD